MHRKIIGVDVTNFAQNSGKVQAVFQEYGCLIRTRLGLHETSSDACAPNGLILLDFIGDQREATEMATKLVALPGVIVKQMDF